VEEINVEADKWYGKQYVNNACPLAQKAKSWLATARHAQ